MLASFLSSSMSCRVLNLTVLFSTLLCWIGTIVIFGAELFNTSNPDYPQSSAASFYWNRVHKSDGTMYYSSSDWATLYNGFEGSPGSQCYNSGNFLFVTAFFSFLPYTLIVFPALLCRIMDFRLPVIGSSPDKSVAIEFVCHCWVVFWVFLGVCAFGAQCWQPVGAASSYTLASNNGVGSLNVKGKMTGFAYVIFVFLMMVLNVVLMVLIKRDPSNHIGSEQRAGGFEGAAEYAPQYDERSTGNTQTGGESVYSAGSYQNVDGNNAL